MPPLKLSDSLWTWPWVVAARACLCRLVRPFIRVRAKLGCWRGLLLSRGGVTSAVGDAEICPSLYASTIRPYTVKTVLVIKVHWVRPTIPQTFSYLTFQLVPSLPVHLQIYLPTEWFTRPLQRIFTEFQEENVSLTSASLLLGHFSLSSSESFFAFCVGDLSPP